MVLEAPAAAPASAPCASLRASPWPVKVAWWRMTLYKQTSSSPQITSRTARCFQNAMVAIWLRQPPAAGRKPPVQMRSTENKCTGRMNVANPMEAASVEKGSIHTAESCIKGVITVLLAELKAHNVKKYAPKCTHPPTAAPARRDMSLKPPSRPPRWVTSLKEAPPRPKTHVAIVTVRIETQPLTRAFCSGVSRPQLSGAGTMSLAFPAPSASFVAVACCSATALRRSRREPARCRARGVVLAAEVGVGGWWLPRGWWVALGGGFASAFEGGSTTASSSATDGAMGKMQASQMTSLMAQQQVAPTTCHNHPSDSVPGTSPSNTFGISLARLATTWSVRGPLIFMASPQSQPAEACRGL
mmetsp:Transcript_174608/g.559796  ORF Transcript_174608/g.559796 Transcript_174608/m.559796 type:complete len:358 (-) Transcript_174608:4-1077(-)